MVVTSTTVRVGAQRTLGVRQIVTVSGDRGRALVTKERVTAITTSVSALTPTTLAYQVSLDVLPAHAEVDTIGLCVD